jgi:signal transduction histidine kinase
MFMGRDSSTVERRAENLLGEDYSAVELVRSAPGIDTFYATDTRDQRRVVVKRIAPPLAPDALARLDHDVAALQRSLSRGPEWSSTTDSTLLIRPFVTGTTLAERLRDGALSLRHVLTLALELLDQLERVHAVGVVHGYITPSNVVTVPHGQATLVDFAFSSYRLRDTPVVELPPETVAYLAPEQAGLLARPVDGRADLYALGIVLYEALVGRLPFASDNTAALLRARLTHRVAPPTAIVTGVPAALDLVIDRLLAKEPTDRYQSARGVRVDLSELATALDRGDADPWFSIGGADLRSALAEPAFVGRATELASLERAFRDAASGRGGLLLVAAESGSGKTRLLEELGRRVAATGAWVLHGEGLDNSAQRPYEVIAGVAREVAVAMASDAAGAESLRARVGALAGVICESLPVVAPVLGHALADSRAPTEQGDARSLLALDCLFDALGTRERPALVLLDDAQWADAPTLRLLERWAGQHGEQGATARHVLIVAAFRSEDLAADRFAGVRNAPSVQLAPLSAAALQQLIRSMTGPVPDSVIELLSDHAGGNPFLAVTVVHGLHSCGALVHAHGAWQLDVDALAALRLSGRLDHLVLARLERLEPTTRSLLAVGAVLGRTFDSVLAGSLLELPPDEARARLERCGNMLLWVERADGVACTIIHDRIRDALLASLSEADRRALHHRAAEALQLSAPDRIFEIAYHFAAAGEPGHALPYALEAGRRARMRWDLEAAERQLKLATRGIEHAAPAVRFELALALGDVYHLRNRYDEAERWLLEAKRLASSPLQRAQVEELFCMLELKRGNLARACERAEAALRLVGRFVPSSELEATVASLWEAGVQVVHTYLPRRWLGRRELDSADESFLAIRQYFNLNGPYFLGRGAMWAAWAHLRHLNVSERYPPTLELGRAWAQHAPMLSGFPSLFARGQRAATRGAELCGERGDLWGQARATGNLSMVLHFSSRFGEALDKAREAAASLDRLGDHWEANTWLCFAATSLLRLGDLPGALAAAKQLWQRGEDSGAAHASAWALDVWARATDGRVPAEMVADARARAKDSLQSWLMLSQAEAVRLLGAGQPREAEQVLELAVQRTRKEARFFHDQNTPLLIYLLAALRAQLEQCSPLDPRGRDQLLARARKAGRPALRMARRFRNNLPHALRENALIDAMAGDAQAAKRQLDESVAVATELSEAYELALSREARGRVGVALAWPQAADELEAARRDLSRLRRGVEPGTIGADPAAGLSLRDRYATILDAGRQIATALSPDAIYSALRDAAVALLRPQQCVVLAVTGDRPHAVLGNAGHRLARDLIDEAVASGRPVARGANDMRSVLCAPISVRNSVAACLYVAHGEVSALFGDEERRIGEYLATLAGAALENAEGFQNVRAFSQELERRVAERTKQLMRAGRMAAVGTLVAGISHELNNPLAVILGYAQLMLAKTPSDAPLRSPVASIERQARRASELVKALLGFSHRQRDARTALAPADLIQNVMALLAGQPRTRGISIETRVTRDVPEILGNRQEIESAILNLMANALDATPEGGKVELTVERAMNDDVVGVQLEIRDTGTGISADALPHVFDPFYTTKPPGEGTGLGLSITREIVMTHDGQIEVDSQPGVGTTMRVWLPAPRAQSGAA